MTRLRTVIVPVMGVWGIWMTFQGIQMQNSESYVVHDDERLLNIPAPGNATFVRRTSQGLRRTTNMSTTLADASSNNPQSASDLMVPDGLLVLNHFRNKKFGKTGSGPGVPVRTAKIYRPTVHSYQRKYPKVLFYVHIHKSAGTLFCRLAFKNRVNTNHASNCNVQDDQHCCGGTDTLQAQISFATETYLDLVATERELYDSMAPDYFDYIVTLRDSKSRYYSHYSHLRRMMPVGPGYQVGGFGDSAWIFGNNSILNRKIKRRVVPVGEDPLGTFSDWYQGQPDNWNVRILCGAKCRPQPKYQITQALFQYTLHRANEFRHFLFVEDLESSYNQMAQEYRWYNFSDDAYTYVHDHNGNRRNDKNGVDHRLANETWDPFMSALDDALYEFAQRKYHHVDAKELWVPFRNHEILTRYFAEGGSLRCKNACCGNCTAY